MNDHARDILAMAALNGQRQAFGSLKDIHGGLCAIGVLTNALFGEARSCRTYEENKLFVDRYGIGWAQSLEIQSANDVLRWDFLTISRKCCLGEGQAPQG